MKAYTLMKAYTMNKLLAALKSVIAGKPDAYDAICQEIVKDESLFNHIVHYVSGDPEGLNDYPEDTRKLEAILKRMPPLHAGGRGMVPQYFYRGETENRKFDSPTRLVESWTPNKETAEDFAKNVGGVVRRTKAPVQGVEIADLVYWRMVLKPNESHYSSGQAEWLLLRPKKVEIIP